MVDAITSFVIGKMGNYLIEEASALMGIKDELEDLKTELMCIQGYLKDDEAREREDEVSKVWTKLVLDIAYDVEDVLDRYYLKAIERSQSQGLVRRKTNKIGEKMDAYRIVDDVRSLKRRILDVTRKRDTFGIGNSSEPRGENNTTRRLKVIRQVRCVDDQEDELVVGLEEDVKILLGKLLDEDSGYMMSIFGMGGLGKTALARRLYNSGEVKRRFDYRAWTSVSQEYKTRDMLMRIIRSLGVVSLEEMEKIKGMEEEELEVYLRGVLEGKTYLVVVDDIWEREAWESLKRAFPCNQRKGSRVIITTRIRGVAEGIDERVYAHKLRCLTFEESWNLFEKKAFRGIEQEVDQELKKTGQVMVRKCGGLPLSIIVLAGILARKKRANEWSEVCVSFWRRLKDNSLHVSTVFDLSFKELRHELKLCFLYLSVFPEDYEIDVPTLIRLLVAEGFIQEEDEEEMMMMEDVARCYIEELIDRSLVEAVRIERGKVMSCRIHDLLRDVVVKKAKELSFVNVYNEQHSSTCCRREAVHQIRYKDHLCDRRVNKRMRSFLFFGERKGLLGSCVQTKTLDLKLLRVLNLGGLLFLCKGYIPQSLPDVIGGLIHLRYLGISDTGLTVLPPFISNLRCLQTLEASGSYSFEETTDLSKLTSLRHVIGKFTGELLIGEALNLQTLKSISSYSWSKLKHELLKNIRELEIYDDSRFLRNQSRVVLNLSSFSKLSSLRILKLEVASFDFSSLQIELIFLSLESLTLVGTNLKEDPMPALQKLPRLEDLVLKDCEWFGLGAKMRISSQGFRRLRKLELITKRLDELRIEDEAVPSLLKLNLETQHGATKLVIPDWLQVHVGAFRRILLVRRSSLPP